MGKLTEFVEKKAATANPKISPEEWMAKALKTISNVYSATHVGKYSHPNANVFLNDTKKTCTNGYVTTENTEVPRDLAYTSAGDMKPASLLIHPVEDGRAVYFHLKERDPVVMQEIRNLASDPEKWIADLKYLDHGDPLETFNGLRQVYFPVKDDYHLLTVLPASSMLEKVKRKANNLHDKRKDATEYDSLPPTVSIQFGGSKPQNVSARNNVEHGQFVLLCSLPPAISDDYVWKPKKDFFQEYHITKECSEQFNKLLGFFLLAPDVNSRNIRRNERERIDAIIDLLLSKAIPLQNMPGWTEDDKYGNLPPAQRCWLDLAYRNDHESENWEEEISLQFGRWFNVTCNDRFKRYGIRLSDKQLPYFAKQMKAVLQWGGDEDEISSD